MKITKIIACCTLIFILVFMAYWIVILKHREVRLFELVIQQQETIKGYETMVDEMLDELTKARLGGDWPHRNTREHTHAS